MKSAKKHALPTPVYEGGPLRAALHRIVRAMSGEPERRERERVELPKGRPCLMTARVRIKGPDGEREVKLGDAIVEWIEKGAFAWVAAARAGISVATFHTWMMKGAQNVEKHESSDAIELDMYGRFYLDVQRARAEARTVAETAVMVDNPLAWLRYGPGREKPGEPGWTDSSKVELTGKDGGPLAVNTPQRLDLKRYTAAQLDELERLLAIGSMTDDDVS